MFWIVFVGGCAALVLLILAFDRYRRVDLHAEIGETKTTIRKPDGEVLFTLSNEMVIVREGRAESIIAVGKRGEVGFRGDDALPADAEVVDLLSDSALGGGKGRLFWVRFLTFCRLVGLQQVLGRDDVGSWLQSTRLLVDVEGAPASLGPLLSKSIFGWLLGDPLIVPKARARSEPRS